MELNEAYRVGGELCAELEPFCDKIQIAGSVRRERPVVNDLDIVLIPKDEDMKHHIQQLCLAKHPVFGFDEKPKSGPAMTRFYSEKHEIWVDIYFATFETWPFILFIRTGSKEHNVYMCMTAKERGMWLCADGSGFFKDREKKAAFEIHTEKDIFSVLGLSYKEPKEREASS